MDNWKEIEDCNVLHVWTNEETGETVELFRIN